jgi:hypothetical protein
LNNNSAAPADPARYKMQGTRFVRLWSSSSYVRKHKI